MNKSRYSLGLRKVQPTIHKSTIGKFSGFCQTKSINLKKSKDFLNDLLTPVTMYLYNIFTGIAVWCCHVDSQDLINDRTSLVMELSMIEMMRS